MEQTVTALLPRLEALLDRVEQLLPDTPAPTNWQSLAWRWRRDARGGTLQAIANPHRIELADLLGIERQKARVIANTEQFLAGLPANHLLLWGSRGTGKSSLIKALLTHYADRGLRLIEVDREHLTDLPDILALTAGRPESFIIYCDDLSFEAGQGSYKTLKAALDGSLAQPGDRVLICATSNRRHLLPEYASDNAASYLEGEELHHGEAVEEKISLSERFGLWLAFHPFDQAQYLAIVDHWLARLGLADACAANGELRELALRWALTRGSRSGRSARQFALDWVGKTRLAGQG